jgi:hypothetical protein
MKQLLRSASLIALVAGMAAAAEVSGVLMDKMCSAKAAQQGQKAALDHTRQCALMPPCQQSGFGIVTADNRFLTFDDPGNAKALAALKASNKKDNLKVTVTGDVQGDSIKVASLKLE